MTRYCRSSFVGRSISSVALLKSAMRARVQGQRPVNLLDIGGRDGLSRPWQWLYRLGVIKPAFVEPDPAEAARLSRRYPNSNVIDKAVWSNDGSATLHLTSQPGCSSLLIPSPDARLPANVAEMFGITDKIEVEIGRAEDQLVKFGFEPEIVKIDVQGGELEVLRGFGDALTSVLCIEIELSFLRCYEGQPLIGEVYEYLIDQGFGLFDLQAFGVAGTRNAVQTNAVFARRRIDGERQIFVERLFRSVYGYSYWP